MIEKSRTRDLTECAIELRSAQRNIICRLSGQCAYDSAEAPLANCGSLDSITRAILAGPCIFAVAVALLGRPAPVPRAAPAAIANQACRKEEGVIPRQHFARRPGRRASPSIRIRRTIVKCPLGEEAGRCEIGSSWCTPSRGLTLQQLDRGERSTARRRSPRRPPRPTAIRQTAVPCAR